MLNGVILPIFMSILFATIPPGVPVQAGQQKTKPIIRQVEHVLIEANDPKILFAFFADTLQLPVAWPIADYSGFISGGVGAGNVNLELLRLADQKDRGSSRSPEARFIGLALEPYRLADCLSALQARGIAYDPPLPYVSRLPDGAEGTLWTNVVLSRLSRPGLSIFLCEYNSAFLHAEIRRNQLGGQLALRNGGPLGIKSAKEIVIGTQNLTRDSSYWRQLISTSAPASPAHLQFGSGPSIHLVRDSTDRIQRIVFRVNSLRSARDFLSEKHLLGAASAGEIGIDPSRIQGLGIRLAER